MPPRTMRRRTLRAPRGVSDRSRTCVPSSMVSRPVPVSPRATSTEAGITMSTRFAQPSKASSLIVVSPSGRMTRRSDVAFSKAPAPTVVVPAATVASLSELAGA